MTSCEARIQAVMPKVPRVKRPADVVEAALLVGMIATGDAKVT